MQQQRELYPDKQPRQLQRLSDTRWACRHGAINAVCCTFDAVVSTLSAIVNGNNGVKSAEARGLLLQVSSFRFVLCLVVFDKILSCTKSLSDTLQSTQLDLARAADLVSATIDTLEEFRSDQEWQKVFEYCDSVSNTVTVCKAHSIAPDTNSRSRRVPKRLEDGILLEGVGVRDASSDHKISLFYPILDAFLSELRRFTSKNVSIMKALNLVILSPIISSVWIIYSLLSIHTPWISRHLSQNCH